MTGQHDLRRQARLACAVSVKVRWCDASGNEKFANASALDISQSGVRLKVPEPLPVLACVAVSSEKLKLRGEASVRHCSRLGVNYTAGLEFVRGIRWTPPPVQ